MNSRSEKYRTIDRRFLWHPYSRHSAIAKDDFPVIVRGQGPYLFDSDGRRYFDAISSWWCCNLGHNHPRLVEAIRAQAGKLQHSILGNMSHPPAIELAEKLAGLFKDKNRRVFFSSDGSSAVEAAVKIAVQYWHNIGKPKRCRLVSLEGAYHGDTLGAVSAGFLPEFHRPFQSLLFPVYRAAAPDCADCSKNMSITERSFVGRASFDRLKTLSKVEGLAASPSSDPGTSPFDRLKTLSKVEGQAKALHEKKLKSQKCNVHSIGLPPESCDCACFKSMRQIIEKHAGEIAAVIIEPLCQCAAGMRIYPPAYLKKLAQLCRAHKILLIADEIAVGFGRTGALFAFEQAEIEPDIVCLGKGLAGGYLPISAAIVKESIYASFSDSPPFVPTSGRVGTTGGVVQKDNTFYHGHTFAGNPLACAAALEALKIYKEEDIVAQAARNGRALAEKMAVLQSIQGVRNVRSLGMIGAFEVDNPARASAVKKALLENGALIRPLGNTIYLMPPLNTPEKLLGGVIDLLGKAIEDVN